MGYPMTWQRALARNELCGNYTRPYAPDGQPYAVAQIEALGPSVASRLRMIAGDFRRVEQDSVDGKEATQWIADRAGVDPQIVIKVLTAFFHDTPSLPPHDG